MKMDRGPHWPPGLSLDIPDLSCFLPKVWTQQGGFRHNNMWIILLSVNSSNKSVLQWLLETWGPILGRAGSVRLCLHVSAELNECGAWALFDSFTASLNAFSTTPINNTYFDVFLFHVWALSLTAAKGYRWRQSYLKHFTTTQTK